MRQPGLALVLVGAALGTGCASVQVDTIHDPAASFAAYRTFAFMGGGGAAVGPTGVDNPMIAREIEDAIRSELVARGFRETDDPTFQVAFHAAVNEGLDVDTFVNYYGYRRRGVWIEEQEIREYAEGTLIIDVVDAGSNELAWRGTGQSEVSDLRDPGRRGDTIRTAVRQILSRFPPGS